MSSLFLYLSITFVCFSVFLHHCQFVSLSSLFLYFLYLRLFFLSFCISVNMYLCLIYSSISPFYFFCLSVFLYLCNLCKHSVINMTVELHTLIQFLSVSLPVSCLSFRIAVLPYLSVSLSFFITVNLSLCLL